MTWHVAFTLARAEAIAEHYLRRVGYGTMYLHEAVTVRHARQVTNVLRPYFPRYVFFETALRGPAEGLYSAAKAQGVSQVVGRAGEPLEVPQKVMDELRRRAGPTGLIHAKRAEEAHFHQPGGEVRIVRGSLEGFIAQVALDNGHEIRLWLEIFGRPTEARIPSKDVEAVSPALAAL